MNNLIKNLDYAIISGVIAAAVISTIGICFYVQGIRKDVAEMKTLLHAIERKIKDE